MINDLTAMGFTTTAKGGKKTGISGSASRSYKVRSNSKVHSDALGLKSNINSGKGTGNNSSQVFYPQAMTEGSSSLTNGIED